jgi:hypothetical protein
MIRFFLRTIGLWLLAAGFVMLVYDGTKSIASEGLYFTRVEDFWTTLHQSSLTALKPMLEHYAAWLWTPAMTTFLRQPVLVVFVVLGILLMLLGRKKKPLIGYGRD